MARNEFHRFFVRQYFKTVKQLGNDHLSPLVAHLKELSELTMIAKNGRTKYFVEAASRKSRRIRYLDASSNFN